MGTDVAGGVVIKVEDMPGMLRSLVSMYPSVVLHLNHHAALQLARRIENYAQMAERHDVLLAQRRDTDLKLQEIDKRLKGLIWQVVLAYGFGLAGGLILAIPALESLGWF